MKLELKDLPLKGKRVLMRVDFNVPLSSEGKITDDSRLLAALPSIQYVLDHGASVILMAHLGRPEGKPNPKWSLKLVAEKLAHILQKPVALAPDCIGPEVKKMALSLRPGQILMLENVRFHEAEEEPEKDLSFAKQLAELGDLYVDDAFGAAHRAHSSITLITKYFPNKAAMGFLIEKEMASLTPLLQMPNRPFYAIIGGAKVSTKAGVIHNLLKRIDALFIGGAMAFTFLKAKGIEIGASPFEAGELKRAKEILSYEKPLYLPTDLVIADAFSNSANTQIVASIDGIPEKWQGMDIGPNTIKKWASLLQNSATVFWNGPLGVFEMPHFAKGTYEIAKTLANTNAEVIVGGGDSVAAIQQMGLQDQFTHLSTGGGAALELLEFGHLPGIDALSNKEFTIS